MNIFKEEPAVLFSRCWGMYQKAKMDQGAIVKDRISSICTAILGPYNIQLLVNEKRIKCIFCIYCCINHGLGKLV